MPSPRPSVLPSEELEPFAVKLIGRFFIYCEEAEGEFEVERRCECFWFIMLALDKISIACEAPHFTIAVMNEMRRVADYIEHKTGRRPE